MSRPKPIHLGEVRASAIRGPRKDGRWYWRARRRGARDTLGTWWATPEEAALEVAGLVHEGLPAPASRAAVPQVGARLADLLGAWVEHQDSRIGRGPGNIAASSARAYRSRAEVLVGYIGELLLIQVQRADVEEMLDAMARAGVSPRTMRSYVTVLRLAWGWGRKRGHVPDRGLELQGVVPRPRGYVYEDYTPTWAEVRRLVEVAPDTPEGRALLLLTWTGMRLAEAVGGEGLPGVRTEDLRLEEGHIHLVGKGRRPRRVPVGPHARAKLAEWSAEAETGATVLGTYARKVQRLLKNLCGEAGIPRCTPHALRRAVVMRLLERGDVKQVALITGHSVSQLLDAYARPTDTSLARLVAAADLDGEGGSVIHLPVTGSGHKA